MQRWLAFIIIAAIVIYWVQDHWRYYANLLRGKLDLKTFIIAEASVIILVICLIALLVLWSWDSLVYLKNRIALLFWFL